MHLLIRLLALILCATLLFSSDENPGFDAPAFPPHWTAAQCAALQATAATLTEANHQLRDEADAALNRDPQPVAIILYEGHLGDHPDRIDTVGHLADISAIRALCYQWILTQDARYADAAQRYILAWATTYKPTGNPINENKLSSLISGYAYLRTRMSADDGIVVDAWLRDLARQEMKGKQTTNWESKRIKIVALIGIALNDDILKTWAHDRYVVYLGVGLHPDGSSEDFHKRDALSYHSGGLKPLLELCLIANSNGDDWYHAEAANGASVAKSVAFMIPYIDGTKTHAEWVTTTVQLDRQRAASGDPHYQPGRIYQPKEALGVLDLAGAFEPAYVVLAATIRGDQPMSWNAGVALAQANN